MKSLFSFLILLLILGAFYFFQEDILKLFSQFRGLQESVRKVSQEVTVEKIKSEISSPTPLRATKESPEAFLTRSGVITWTNLQRKNQGLPPLSENTKLNQAATLKTKDMFEKQYFAHISPAGIGTGDLADRVEYQFIAIGENLALGNFADDKTLVQSWMASPGHRANILSSRYTEIGVAVAKGNFEGKSTWIAVQEFSFPLSACPEPNASLQVQIEENQIQLQGLERELTEREKELKRMQPKWGLEYDNKAEGYDALVFQYNTLAEAIKALVEKYNSQVRAFNLCAGG